MFTHLHEPFFCLQRSVLNAFKLQDFVKYMKVLLHYLNLCYESLRPASLHILFSTVLKRKE